MKQVILITTLIIGIVGLCAAQGAVEERIQKERVSFFNSELQLTEAESSQFWPLYDQYREDEMKLKRSYNQNKKVALMSDEEVEKYIFDSFEMQEKQIAMRREYFEKLRTFLPIRKIAMLNRTELKFKKKLLQHVQDRRQGRRNGPGMRRGSN